MIKAGLFSKQSILPKWCEQANLYHLSEMHAAMKTYHPVTAWYFEVAMSKEALAMDSQKNWK